MSTLVLAAPQLAAPVPKKTSSDAMVPGFRKRKHEATRTRELHGPLPRVGQKRRQMCAKRTAIC